MRKGDLVMLAEPDGTLRRGMAQVLRHLTDTEIEAWYESDASKGMNSAGETKLPPTSRVVRWQPDDTWTVLRARCAPVFNYRKRSGKAKVMNNRTNEIGYVSRDALKLV